MLGCTHSHPGPQVGHPCMHQGPAQILPPFLTYKFLYYKVISMSFCNTTTSHSSTPYDTLGEMFELRSISCETFTYPTNHSRRRYFCRTLYIKGLALPVCDMKESQTVLFYFCEKYHWHSSRDCTESADCFR